MADTPWKPPATERTICGAKNRAGQPCRKSPMPNGRCANHGGKTPKGQRNALKHGIYSDVLFEDERQLWEEIPLGTLDDEIRILRLRLRRALGAQKEVERRTVFGEGLEAAPAAGAHPAGFELSEIETSTKTGRKLTHRRPDYRVEIFRLTGRIAQLERMRAALAAVGGGPDADDEARAIRDALDEIDRLERGETSDDDADPAVDPA